jgi:hypothetical protein
VTNDPLYAGIDRRSRVGRRFTDLVEAALVEFGSHDLDKIRALASLRVSLEQAQHEVLSGDAAVREDLVRLSNLVAKREKELRLAMRQHDASKVSVNASAPAPVNSAPPSRLAQLLDSAR